MVVQKLTSSAAKRKKCINVSVCIDLFILFKVSNGLVHIEMQRRKNYRVFFRQKPVKRHCWRCRFRTVNFFFIISFYQPFIMFSFFCAASATANHDGGVQSNKSSKSFFPLEITTKTSIYDTDTIPFSWP